MSAPNDKDDGARGRAIAYLARWVRSRDTAEALDAMQLLDLTDTDIEALFREAEQDVGKIIPFRGRVR